MKKTISILVSLIMVISIVTIVPITAKAAGNSFAAATSFTLGRTVNGSITKTNTVDYYTFTLSSSGKVKLTASSEMETVYRIYASSNTNNYIYYKSSESFTDAIELKSGKYYLMIKPYYPSDTGVYSFSTSFTSANETFKESFDKDDDTIAKANSISLGTSYKGHLAINDNVDMYAFTMPSSGSLTFSANSEMDTVYRIYASSNTNSYIYYKSSESYSETIELKSGKYYLVIKPNPTIQASQEVILFQQA